MPTVLVLELVAIMLARYLVPLARSPEPAPNVARYLVPLARSPEPAPPLLMAPAARPMAAAPPLPIPQRPPTGSRTYNCSQGSWTGSGAGTCGGAPGATVNTQFLPIFCFVGAPGSHLYFSPFSCSGSACASGSVNAVFSEFDYGGCSGGCEMMATLSCMDQMDCVCN